MQSLALTVSRVMSVERLFYYSSKFMRRKSTREYVPCVGLAYSLHLTSRRIFAVVSYVDNIQPNCGRFGMQMEELYNCHNVFQVGINYGKESKSVERLYL